MLHRTYSSSIAQIAMGPYEGPETTRPFVLGTKLVGRGTGSHIEVFKGEGGLEMSAYLQGDGGALLSVDCHMVVGNAWVWKRIVEMLVGTFEGFQVAVFRDEEGGAFCPDAPDVPADRVADLVSVAVVEGVQRTRPFGVDTDGNLIGRS